MNRAAFDSYIETQLAPTLCKGDVVLANLAGPILKERGASFLFLPPYSPIATDRNGVFKAQTLL